MSAEIRPRIGLADAIAELRREIGRAKLEGEGKLVRFSAKTIEVELSLEFDLTAEVSAGVSKWIPFVELSGKTGGTEKSLHKVTLTLEIDPNAAPARTISDNTGPAPVVSIFPPVDRG